MTEGGPYTGIVGIPYTLIAANTINNNLIYKGIGNVLQMECFNNSSTIAYVKLYDKATAPATTDTPFWEGMIPAPTSGGGGYSVSINRPFANGLGIIVSGGIAYNDNTAVAASTYIINLSYSREY